MSINLDAIKARLAAATPGPWNVDESRRGVEARICGYPVEVVAWTTHADAALIAAAPADIAALVEEVERLRAEVAAERAAVVAFLRARSMSMGKDHRSITGDSVCWAEIELVGAAVNIERGEHRREETK